MFKVKNNIAPEILTEIVPRRKAIIVLERAQRCRVEVLKLMFDSETISSLRPKIWDILPTELKKTVSPTLFKMKIRKWSPKNCSCRLCET